MPVLILKEISCKYEHLRLACVGCKAYDCLNITRLKQAFYTLHFFVGHRVNLSSKFKLPLSLNELGNSHQDVLPLSLLLRILVSCWNQLGDYLFFQDHIILLSDGKCLNKLVESNHNFNSLFILLILHHELHTGLQNLGVVPVCHTRSNVFDHVTQVVLHR